jgi:hypothetical protein
MPALPAPALRAERAHARQVAPGVVHRSYAIDRGPWSVQVLDVDRSACWMPVAVKGAATAAGRAPVLPLLAARSAIGGVNADFFLFAPSAGVPVSAHVENGVVLAGPGPRPVLAVRADGSIHLGVLPLHGAIVAGRDTIALEAWNRPATGVALFDRHWGARTDSAPARLFVHLQGPSDAPGAPAWAAVAAVRDGVDAASIESGRWVVAVGAATSPAGRARLAALRPGVDSVRVWAALGQGAVREAVGGHPMLVRDGRVLTDVDSAGNAGFRGVNPRTAVGLADGGRRLFLVTVDGRQPGFSVGISLRDLAELMRELGATDALNLDGGGSTTLVVADSMGGTLRIANRPSDATGPRAVGNALGVVRGCAGRVAS